MRNTVLAAAIAAMSIMLPASAQELPAEIRQRGHINVGMEATYPPMAYKDPATNERRGVNIDLVDAIGRELGIPLRLE